VAEVVGVVLVVVVIVVDTVITGLSASVSSALCHVQRHSHVCTRTAGVRAEDGKFTGSVFSWSTGSHP